MASSDAVSDPAAQPDAAYLGDASVLRAAPTLRELRAFHRGSGASWFRSVAAAVIGSLLLVAVLFAAAILIQPLLTEAPLVARLVAAGAPLYWAALAIVGLAWWLRWRLRDARLWRFARANDLAFAHRIESGSESWHIARDGHGFPENMRNVEEASLGRLDDVIVARNRVVPPKDTQPMSLRRPFAFACLKLPSHVPQIILKNRRSRILPLAGLGLGNRRRLSLEGDFDRHFTLLCPEGYERDALQIFTPDVMAAVIDTAGRMEIELVEDHLYCYFPFATPLWRPEVMDRMQRLLALLERKFGRQTRHYRDDRVLLDRAADGRIARSGRRMSDRNGVSAVSVLATGAVLVVSAVIGGLSLFVFPNL